MFRDSSELDDGVREGERVRPEARGRAARAENGSENKDTYGQGSGDRPASMVLTRENAVAECMRTLGRRDDCDTKVD